MSTAPQILTQSRAACFRACPRRHYLRFELGLRPAIESQPARVGSAFHAALDAIDKGTDVDTAFDLGDPFDTAMVAAMVYGHSIRWQESGVAPLASEMEFDLPLVNPESGTATPIWRMAGKIDRIVRLPDGRVALMEYKTTSRDFAPGADYWLRLHMDQQLSVYVIAARALGYPVETILYDVTRRPALRPLKATPVEARKYTKEGRLYANQRETDETPEEFAARVSADIAERPDHYFARIEIARLDQDLEDCQRELWQQQLAIRQAQRAGHWYRNPGACFEPHACAFLPICQDRDLEDRTPLGFVRLVELHPELSDATPGASPACPASGLADAR